jgi:hypothetical protein
MKKAILSLTAIGLVSSPLFGKTIKEGAKELSYNLDFATDDKSFQGSMENMYFPDTGVDVGGGLSAISGTPALNFHMYIQDNLAVGFVFDYTSMDVEGESCYEDEYESYNYYTDEYQYRTEKICSSAEAELSVRKFGPSVKYHQPINENFNLSAGGSIYDINLDISLDESSDETYYYEEYETNADYSSDFFDNIGIEAFVGATYFFNDNIALNTYFSYKRLSLEFEESEAGTSEKAETTLTGFSQKISLSIFF